MPPFPSFPRKTCQGAQTFDRQHSQRRPRILREFSPLSRYHRFTVGEPTVPNASGPRTTPEEKIIETHRTTQPTGRRVPSGTWVRRTLTRLQHYLSTILTSPPDDRRRADADRLSNHLVPVLLKAHRKHPRPAITELALRLANSSRKMARFTMVSSIHHVYTAGVAYVQDRHIRCLSVGLIASYFTAARTEFSGRRCAASLLFCGHRAVARPALS